ncbi:MAG: DUF4293 domain-containing protein [Bacteroidota bacterium]
MIQRIQSLYLLLAALVSGGLIFIFYLWTNQSGNDIYAINIISEEDLLLKSTGILFILSSILSIISIFLYKNRKIQIVINRLNIVLNFFLLGIIVYLLLTLSGETVVSKKGIGSFIPLIAILFLVLANKAIIKDEKLVKSVDRLR